MKLNRSLRPAGKFIAVALFVGANCAGQTNFTVTTPNLQYAINGVTSGSPGFFTNNSPPLTLVAGNTYKFTMMAGIIHPMVINTNSSGPTPLAFQYPGASPQDISSGTITLAIPSTGFPTTMYYQCNNHGFYGIITVVPPSSPAPPPNQILSISVTTNVLLISTGTNTTWTLVPEFSSNLVSGLWAPVLNYTNYFSNGTNLTSFGRLESFCGPNVFLRVNQRQN